MKNESKIEKAVENVKDWLRIGTLYFLIYGVPAIGVHGCSQNKYARENGFREHQPSAGIRTLENRKNVLKYQDALIEKYFKK